MGLARRVPAGWERETNPSLLFAGARHSGQLSALAIAANAVGAHRGRSSAPVRAAHWPEPPAGGLPGV